MISEYFMLDLKYESMFYRRAAQLHAYEYN